ncbi:MAG TPA: histidine phosphatase family protein [Burkholderiales bacterium]|nr:histidine phosphatase family protein [Burkholderiales bacterium]
MDLILWRHADAENGADDAARRLTPKGIKQASRMGAWLDSRLPKDARLLVSPAVRAQQTAQALPREANTSEKVKTGAEAAQILAAAGWPHGSGTVVVVGHQPTLGAAAALALTGKASSWHLKKAGVWWLSANDDEPAAVIAVMSVDLL